ncbi:alpha/beta hydrolase [Kitasatospora mediocidica]|uniref:alpha/beta hydrolase n=1 Tax=Kitasatospora mediocidica TaxID=58352 RepID=UPI000689D99B|nr:alpha/beta hydrolase [Kitasatospora mediocidica]
MTNIVLVHGLWADGSCWDRVVASLQRAGHQVTAAQLRLSSFEDDVTQVARILDGQDGPTVLAGHSYGGAVISAAGSRSARAAALVYVTALAPQREEELGAVLQRFPDLGLEAAMRQDGSGYLTLDPAAFAGVFAADADPGRAAVMAASQKPANGALFTARPQDEPAWKSLPSWYVLATEDRTLNPDAQRFTADRCGATVVEVAAAHAAMVSQPQTVAAVITQAAEHCAL